MKNRQVLLYYIPILFCLLVAVIIYFSVSKKSIDKASFEAENNAIWNPIIAEEVNKNGIKLVVDNIEIDVEPKKLYMNNKMELMIPSNIITETFDFAEFVKDDYLIIQKGGSKAKIKIGSNKIEIDNNSFKLSSKVKLDGGNIYIPQSVFSEHFGYDYKWDSETYTAMFTNKAVDNSYLPERYSYMEEGRSPIAKDQGDLGTCWAFATFTALESSLMPEEKLDFSEDHLVYNNECGADSENGGYYNISMSYLLSWKGPVLEEQDPYGDGNSDESLKPVKHIQQAEIIASKDYQQIKEKVFKYGGVESSIYMSLNNEDSKSIHYNREKAAYCYIGEELANHEIVIIGWDDNFPKEYFSNKDIKQDGAFICINSWGTDFGEDGIFYISYSDTHIGDKNICYTLVEETNNYDNIYQSDLCGWTGTMGYEGSNSVYFANVYTAESNETLKAIGFYATDQDLSYEVFVCEKYEDKNSLNNRNHIAARGEIRNVGYYTIDLDKSYKIKKNEEYAVIVKVTKNNGKQGNLIPLEMVNDTITQVDLTDGKGFISESGHNWQSAEKQGCNICLKAYTNDR